MFNQVLTKFNVSKLLALLILPWVAALRTRYTLDASDMFSSKLGYVGEPKEKKKYCRALVSRESKFSVEIEMNIPETTRE